MKKRAHPFLKRQFPRKREFRILLDGEAMLRAESAKSTMESRNIKLLEDWPKYSPDLNPQEHVWKTAEEILRRSEKPSDTFEDFQKRCLSAVLKHPSPAKLVPSMAKRTNMVHDANGAMIPK